MCLQSLLIKMELKALHSMEMTFIKIKFWMKKRKNIEKMQVLRL